jgi:putative membrane protein
MTIFRKLTALAVAQVAATAVVLAVAARAEDVEDSKFLQNAIQSNIAEVKMSELALQRSNDDEVRDFAHRLQTDHSVSMQQTTALAKDLGTNIPSTPTAEAQEHYASLAKLSGQEFDGAFVNHMVAAHRESIAKFDQEARANPNQAIADFAAKTLPTLKQHLATGEALLGAGAHPSAQPHGAPAEGRDAQSSDPHLRVPPQEPSTPPPL